MKFRVVHQKTPSGAHSPYQVVEQSTGKGVGWINRYLDRDYVRRLANTSLYSYANNLLHFVRWWESVHHTGDISKDDLTESTLLDYVRFQSSLQPPPSAPTINDRVACADHAIRNEFPDAPCQAAHGFQQVYLHRRPLGLGRPRFELSRLRVREPIVDDRDQRPQFTDHRLGSPSHVALQRAKPDEGEGHFSGLLHPAGVPSGTLV
jgi:hypothetical protein